MQKKNLQGKYTGKMMLFFDKVLTFMAKIDKLYTKACTKIVNRILVIWYTKNKYFYKKI